MKSILYALIFTMLLTVCSCDPAYHGKSIIKNETPYMMELKFKIDTAEMFSPPSVTAVMLQIPPDTTIVFANFEGRGNSKYFDCCTCEFDSIAINLIDSSKVITKSISSESNWETFNPNKSLGNKEIECRFKITSSDIQ